MTVRSELDGHEFDLAALARHFPTGDPRIVNDDGRTYLEATALDDVFNDGGQTRRDGQRALGPAQDRSTLDDAGYRPVKLLNRFVDGPADTHLVVGDQAGVREHAVVVAVTAEARLGVSSLGSRSTASP